MGVFGKKINQELLSLDVDTTMVRVSGFVGKPETARKKGARQYFFVNGRYMRHEEIVTFNMDIRMYGGHIFCNSQTQ